MPLKRKMFSVGWQVTYTPPPSGHGHVSILKHFEGHKQMTVWQGKVREQLLESEKCGQQYEDTHCHAKYSSMWQMSLIFTPNFQLQLVTKHLTVMTTVYCHTLFLIILEEWSSRISEKCEHHYFWCWLRF